MTEGREVALLDAFDKEATQSSNSGYIPIGSWHRRMQSFQSAGVGGRGKRDGLDVHK